MKSKIIRIRAKF